MSSTCRAVVAARRCSDSMTAVAASLAAVIALQAYRPELLPEQFRVKPKIVTVVKAPPPPVSSRLSHCFSRTRRCPHSF